MTSQKSRAKISKIIGSLKKKITNVMKRVLEDELISLAERILKLKNRADIHQLKKETAVLYEKLSILAFAESHFGGLKSDISKTEFKEAFSEQFSDIDEDSGHLKSPDGLDYNPEPISEPNTEKIKDIVSQMPPESEQVDLLLQEFAKLASHKKSTLDKDKASEDQTTDDEPQKDDSQLSSKAEDPTEDDFKSYGVHFDDLPDFEPRSDKTENDDQPDINTESPQQEESSKPDQSQLPKSEKMRTNLNSRHQEKRSLNDRLKKSIKIGLNDRIAFTNKLFGGNTDDYNRVLSQLNTMSSYDEVKQFIQSQVKPDYKHWEGKEAIEERFMQIVERKFDA